MLRKQTALNAALYILNKLGQTDTHKLGKILYFADREHLARYGRTITGDEYIAMQYGPVPSAIYDTVKLAYGASCLPKAIEEAKEYFVPVAKYAVNAGKPADMDYLSESDVECLDFAIGKYGNKTFDELVQESHNYAWHNAGLNNKIAVADIMKEVTCDEEQISHIIEQISQEEELNYGAA